MMLAEEAITTKEMAAVVLVNLGLETYASLGVWPTQNQAYILEQGKAIACGLNFRPQEKEAAIAKCRALLGIK